MDGGETVRGTWRWCREVCYNRAFGIADKARRKSRGFLPVLSRVLVHALIPIASTVPPAVPPGRSSLRTIAGEEYSYPNHRERLWQASWYMVYGWGCQKPLLTRESRWDAVPAAPDRSRLRMGESIFRTRRRSP
jgi:hypothetical protein